MKGGLKVEELEKKRKYKADWIRNYRKTEKGAKAIKATNERYWKNRILKEMGIDPETLKAK